MPVDRKKNIFKLVKISHVIYTNYSVWGVWFHINLDLDLLAYILKRHSVFHNNAIFNCSVCVCMQILYKLSHSCFLRFRYLLFKNLVHVIEALFYCLDKAAYVTRICAHVQSQLLVVCAIPCKRCVYNSLYG